MKNVQWLVLACLWGGALSCASQKTINERPLDLPFSKIYPADYETVWQATVHVMDIYSISLARKDTGQIETDWIIARYNQDLYDYPFKNPFLEEVRYRLKIKLAKGFVAENNKPAVRVQVTKELSTYKNIVVDWERIPTDQVEESVILYRIGQRINILETIKNSRRNTR